MDIITKIDEKIINLDDRFNKLLENFVTNYALYLKTPSNQTYEEEKNYVFNTIQELNRDGFLLINEMQTIMQTTSTNVGELNIKINKLKLQNKKLKTIEKQLLEQNQTAVGLFDEEVEWYKYNLKDLIIRIIGVIIGMVFIKKLDLSTPELIKVLIIGFILFVIYNSILSYMKD